MNFNEVKIFEQSNNPYENPNNTVLYRYENPEHSYDDRREGVVSKEELVGSWYCDSLKDLHEYTLMRKPGGKFIAISIPTSDLEKYDASKREDTKYMDIESGNYIVTPETAQDSKIEIPLEIETTSQKRFLFKDFHNIQNYIQEKLTNENLSKLYVNK